MAPTQYTCRWAALSLSSIATVFIPDIQLPREASEPIKHELVAISTSRTREHARDWLTQHQIKDADSVTIYEDWEDMLRDGDFDVVYISTPHPLHYQHVRKALELKRHVLVEKPATMNAAQFEALAAVAQRQGVVLMEAMWTRYLPATRYLQEKLLPQIGEVRRVYAEFSFPIVSPTLHHSSRFLDKAAGAGSLLDQGVYALTWADLALNGCDDSSSVTEVVHANSMEVPEVPGSVDDIDTVVLVKRDQTTSVPQAVGIVSTSMTLPGSSKPAFHDRLQARKSAPSVRIEATKASVAIPFPPIRPQELHVQWYDEAHLDEKGTEKEEVVKKPAKRGWGLWYQADVLAARIASRTASDKGEVIGGEETLRVLRWMDEARRASGIHYDAELEQV